MIHFIKTTFESLSRKHGLETRLVIETSDKMYTIRNMPSQVEAKTGFVYVNIEEDLFTYVIVNDKWIYRCAPHPDIEKNQIAMNAAQRRENKKCVNDLVDVSPFHVHLNEETALKTLTLDAEFLKSETLLDVPDLKALTTDFGNQYKGHVLQTDQVVLMDFNNHIIRFVVTSNSLGRATQDTEISIQWNAY